MNKPTTGYKNIKLPAFWMVVVTINIVLGTAIGVIRLTIGDAEALSSPPPFVLLSQQATQQADRIHNDLYEKMSRANQRVDIIEQRVDHLDKHFHPTEKHANQGTE